MSELSKQYHSIFIGDRNTWDDWHLVPTSRPVINPPELKENYVEIPGASGDLDYTEVLTGAPVFKNRTGSWEFLVMNGYSEWHNLYNNLLQYFHGKEFDIILEDAPDFKYHGRLKLNEWRSEEHNSKITIDYTISPYRKAVSSSALDWKWDDLTFKSDSYIIYYGSFDVNGSIVRTFHNPSSSDIPLSFSLTADMTVDYYGKTKKFKAGYHEDTGLTLKSIDYNNGNNEITFNGYGRVTVEYDRGELI